MPLLIHHPRSPYKGRHYNPPVELLDIFPTINDLSGAPYVESEVCKMYEPKEIHKCLPLQGKSLAKVVLGDNWGSQTTRHRPLRSKLRGAPMNLTTSNLEPMPSLERDFAISQSWRCATISSLQSAWNGPGVPWKDCSRDDNYNEKGRNETSIMGYSMRTSDFRYTAWVPFNRSIMAASWDQPLFDEELYDHRGETLKDFTHQELVNVAHKPAFSKVVKRHRDKLLNYLRSSIVFHGPYIET